MQATSFMPNTSLLTAQGSGHNGLDKPRGILGYLLLLFILSCVFDPADRVLSLKVWLFVLCWVFTLFICASSRRQAGVPLGLLFYTLLFISVPVWSIAWYAFINGSELFKGFALLKGYLLITMASMLVLNRINLIPQLCAVLTVLAAVVICVFTAIQLDPELFFLLYPLGPSTGIIFLDKRDYGSGLILLQVYIVTSPMLALSIAYYFSRAQSATRPSVKRLFWGLVVINVLGMFLAGTRNNIFVSLLLPIALSFIYAKNKAFGLIISLTVMSIMTLLFTDELRGFVNPTEVSNSVKLAMLEDYGQIFSDPLSLMFGQGLGAYHYFESRGINTYITELTYLELIRNFGILGAMVILGLVLFPVLHAFALNHSRSERAIATGFAFYLVMFISNPGLFDSNGMLILSVVVANIFLSNGAKEKSMDRRKS